MHLSEGGFKVFHPPGLRFRISGAVKVVFGCAYGSYSAGVHIYIYMKLHYTDRVQAPDRVPSLTGPHHTQGRP